MAPSPSVPDVQNSAQEPSARLHPLAIGVGCTVLCLSFMLNAIDRQVFYLLLPEKGKEFGFTLKESGFLATGFTLGLAVAGFLSGFSSGFIVDRFSRKTVIIVSVLVYSAGTAAIPLATAITDMHWRRSRRTVLFNPVQADRSGRRGRAF
jgi:MFS family permease